MISFVRYLNFLDKENLVGNIKVHHEYNNTTIKFLITATEENYSPS